MNAIVLRPQNDPAWWSTINTSSVGSYFVVAAFVAVMYDWALTFGQEVELIWRQRWSLMTVMYLGVRYLGILSAVPAILGSVPTISLTDTQCWITSVVWDWMFVVVSTMLWVIISTRLHAMYQRSRKILTYLIVTLLAISIFNGVVSIMVTMDTSGEELILSGTYQCYIYYANAEDITILISMTWMIGTVWEVLALCLAVWIAVKHFRELRQHSAGGIIGDCFTVLIKTHVVYFASYVAVSCFEIMNDFYLTNLAGISLASEIFSGLIRILVVVQMSVLGPRLILGIREYHAKLVANSDAATGMTSIAFQERVEISTGSGV